MADKVIIWHKSRKSYFKEAGHGFTNDLWEAALINRDKANRLCKESHTIVELDEAFENMQLACRMLRGGK